MATNEILPFSGTDTGTNILTQAEYQADAQRLIGNQPGIARSKLVNKALRQTSLISAAIAEMVAANQPIDVVDTKTVAEMAEMLESAVSLVAGGFVTVKRFGAVCDGVADDIAAFVDAADSGLQIIVPSGDCVLTIANQSQLTAVFGMLDRLHILAGSVTINVAAGSYTETARTELKVTNGNRLKIVGAAPTSLTFSSLVSVVSNGAGNHDITFAFADASSVSVGDFIIVRSLSGSKYGPLEGVWKATAKAGNNVTLKVTARPASLTGITVGSGTFKKMNVVISYVNSIGLYVNSAMGADSANTCGFSNMVLAGDGSANNSGVFVEYDCTITVAGEFGVHGFGRYGFYCLYAGTLNALNACASANGVSGFYGLSGSTMQLVGAVATGNTSYGIVPSVDSVVAGSNSNASGNVTGYYVSGGSSCVNNGALAQYNTSYGIYCDENSYADSTNGTVTYNDTGILVADASFCIFTGGTASNNTTLDGKENDTLSKISGGALSISSLSNYPARILQGSLTHNFGTIAAQSQATATLTIPGISTGKCNLVVTSNGTHVDGLVVQPHPSATDTVLIVASNIKATSISVSNRTYVVTAFMHP